MGIRETIASLKDSEDKDVAYIIAAAINVYWEANRRLIGRSLLIGADVEPLFSMIAMLINPIETTTTEPGHKRRSEAEDKASLGAVEAGLNRRT